MTEIIFFLLKNYAPHVYIINVTSHLGWYTLNCEIDLALKKTIHSYLFPLQCVILKKNTNDLVSGYSNAISLLKF